MVALISRYTRHRDLLLSTGLSFLIRVLAALAAFVISLVIGRQLGAVESGYYFLAFSIVSFLAGVSRIGLDNTVLRFVGSAFADRDWHLVRSVVSKALLLIGLSSSFTAVILYFASDLLADYAFKKPELAPVLDAMAPGVFGLAIFTLLAMGLQGLRRIVASVTTLNILVNAFLVSLLLGLGVASAEYAAWAYSAAACLTAFSGGWLLWSSLRHSQYKLGAELETESSEISWSALFQSCMPLWVVLIMGQLVQWSGQFIAGGFVEAEEVAQLAVAQRTALLTSFVLMAVNLVVAPRFAAMYKQGHMKELQSLALTSVKLMVIFALPIVMVMLIFPEFLMSLFGEGFSGGAHLLQILVLGQFINVATGSVGYLLSMSGHERDLRNTVLISGPVALVLALALVPMWGATGSAIATAIAVATQNLVAVWQVKRRLGFNTLAVWKH